jgi:hypothetical protein
MKECLLNDKGDYKLMSQTGLQQYVFSLDSDHNAIWDTTIMPDGDPYFSLATELSTSGYSRLYRYHYKENKAEELFRVEDVIMPSERAIRASKFHTSISLMNDGKFVMTTHTTDKSPAHPTWMPIPYFHHLWEGYAGSNIVTYDPKTGKAENLGIPVPHETIYGSKYDPKHNALFFTGGFKGHLYRYSFDDKKLMDYGQMSENWSFRLLFDIDGNILANSRSGYMCRIHTDTLELEDLNYRIPFHTYPEYPADYKMLSNGGIGPDGRLYMCFAYSRKFVAFDSKTGSFEDMGDYLPAQSHAQGETRHGVFGCDFDNQGVLWYAVFSRNCDSGRKEIGLPSSLFRWDIARGGKPEWLGIIGTKKRGACWTSEVKINKDDIMYIIGSNHSMDGPDITAVDLKRYRSDMYNFGNELIEDEYFVNRENRRYLDMGNFLYEKMLIAEENRWEVPYSLAYEPVRIWRALAPKDIENSPIELLYWEDDKTLLGLCGKTARYVFKIFEGRLEKIVPAEQDKDTLQKLENKKPVVDKNKYSKLPYYPGRQYKAVASAAVEFGEGRILVGTEDGMLAIVDNNRTHALGPAVYNGPIRCLVSSPNGPVVYGIGGDPDDIDMLFRYDDDSGLRWLGHVSYSAPAAFSAINCPTLTSCTISPNGKILAVGSGDRLGTIMFYKLED